MCNLPSSISSSPSPLSFSSARLKLECPEEYHYTMAQAMEIKGIKIFKSTKLIHAHFLSKPYNFFANGVELTEFFSPKK